MLICGNPCIYEVTGGIIAPYDHDLIAYVTAANPAIIRITEGFPALKIESIVGSTITFDKDHGWTTGDEVFVWALGGLYELNGVRTITVTDTNAISIDGAVFTDSDWTGGGSIRRLLWHSFTFYTNTILTEDRLLVTIPATVEFIPGKDYIIGFEATGTVATVGLDFFVYRETKERAATP